MTVFALIGADALYLLFIWLASAIVASWLSDRKGYGERAGLATGLLLSAIGVIVWLVWPARQDSRWKVQGVIPRRGRQESLAAARARRHHDDAS
jgi:sugar phosphate permease